MIAAPDERVLCRCGRGTYLLSGGDPRRTCSLCGYLTSYCKCKRERPAPFRTGFRLPSVSSRTRAMLGAGVLSAVGTLFAVVFLSSPFMAVFGLGMPLGLAASFFAQWLRDETPRIHPVERSAASPPRQGGLSSRRA